MKAVNQTTTRTLNNERGSTIRLNDAITTINECTAGGWLTKRATARRRKRATGREAACGVFIEKTG